MMMNYDKLFKPYTDDGHTLENTLKYLANLAGRKGISADIMELAVNEIFNQVANGKEFSKEKCSCGCGIDKAGTDLIHAIRDKMLAIDTAKTVMVKNLMQQRYTNIIADQMKRISKTDKKFVKLNQPPLSERSPVLRTLKRIFKHGA